MRRLTRQRRDRGAAALIVCMLFVTGTLFGCAALTVDLGAYPPSVANCRTARTP
jgi:hypothetical protein